jgi:AraC-like DNA-binding protein
MFAQRESYHNNNHKKQFVMIHHSVIGSWLTVLVAGLESYSLDAQAFLSLHGIDYDRDSNPSSRIPLNVINHIWRDAVALTGDEAFGLKVGTMVTPHTLNALGVALWSVCTLREQMQCLARYRGILSTDGGMMAVEEEDGCLVSTTMVEAGPDGQTLYTDYELDAICAAMLTLRRLLYKKDFCPVRMDLTRATPQNPQVFTDYFGCPIRYEQPHLRIHISIEDADTPIPGSSRHLAQATEKIAEDYLQQLHHSDDITLDVRRALIALLPQGKATLDCVAEYLHTSKRTLHRKLEQSKTSFRDQVEAFRQEMAIGYIQQGEMSLGDISFLLGFSSSSNFTRAFKRWTGMTPLEYSKNPQPESRPS